jgi:hypothetical protein
MHIRKAVLVCLGFAAGCGTMMQGAKQRVLITSDPEGAVVTIGSEQVMTPGELLLKRTGWTVVRAEKPGYYPACKVLRAAHNPVYAIGNSIPAGLGWLIDGPTQASRIYPKSIDIELVPLSSRVPRTELPTDDQILAQWRQGNTQVCSTLSELKDRSVWGASYKVTLEGPSHGLAQSTSDMGDGRYAYENSTVAVIAQPSSRGIDLRLTNRSPRAIKVIWDDSVLVAPDGASARVIHAGVPFNAAHESQMPTVIPPGSHVVDRIVPASGQGEALFLPILVRPCDMDEAEFVALAQRQTGSRFKLILALDAKGARQSVELSFRVGELRLRRASSCAANRRRVDVSPPPDSWPY